jgi:hypothetical protein
MHQLIRCRDGYRPKEEMQAELPVWMSRVSEIGAKANTRQVWQPRYPRLKPFRPEALRPHLSMGLPLSATSLCRCGRSVTTVFLQ